MKLNSIAFIPDGNRRYAKKHNISLLESYKLGTKKAWEVLDWMAQYPNVKTGTFYTLSLENFKHRANSELTILFKIFEKELDKLKTNKILEENNLRIKFIGRKEIFSEKLKQKMLEAEQKSQDGERTINLALGYDGQSEIVDAAKKFAQQYKDNTANLEELNEESFTKYLYDNTVTPELIVRTSGTQRLSGFLTYQSAYSELYFLDKYWPEITQQDLNNAVEYYEDIQRNFGK